MTPRLARATVGNRMIERHITFEAAPANAGQFERFFAERYRPAMSLSPGFVSVELLRSAEFPGRYEMAMRWRDGDAATGWRTSAAHAALQPALSDLAAMGAISVFEVVGQANG